MKVSGKSLGDIAVQLEVPKQRVGQLISAQISHEADLLSLEEKDTLLAINNARLERMINAHWEAAMYGDIRAGDMVLKTIALHSKLNKLDIPDAVVNQHAVLVVGGEAADYVERLKQLSG